MTTSFTQGGEMRRSSSLPTTTNTMMTSKGTISASVTSPGANHPSCSSVPQRGAGRVGPLDAFFLCTPETLVRDLEEWLTVAGRVLNPPCTIATTTTTAPVQSTTSAARQEFQRCTASLNQRWLTPEGGGVALVQQHAETHVLPLLFPHWKETVAVAVAEDSFDTSHRHSHELSTPPADTGESVVPHEVRGSCRQVWYGPTSRADNLSLHLRSLQPLSISKCRGDDDITDPSSSVSSPSFLSTSGGLTHASWVPSLTPFLSTPERLSTSRKQNNDNNNNNNSKPNNTRSSATASGPPPPLQALNVGFKLLLTALQGTSGWRRSAVGEEKVDGLRRREHPSSLASISTKQQQEEKQGRPQVPPSSPAVAVTTPGATLEATIDTPNNNNDDDISLCTSPTFSYYLLGCHVFLSRLEEGVRWLEEEVARLRSSSRSGTEPPGQRDLKKWMANVKLIGFCASYVLSSVRCHPESILQSAAAAGVAAAVPLEEVGAALLLERLCAVHQRVCGIMARLHADGHHAARDSTTSSSGIEKEGMEAARLVQEHVERRLLKTLFLLGTHLRGADGTAAETGLTTGGGVWPIRVSRVLTMLLFANPHPMGATTLGRASAAGQHPLSLSLSSSLLEGIGEGWEGLAVFSRFLTLIEGVFHATMMAVALSTKRKEKKASATAAALLPIWWQVEWFLALLLVWVPGVPPVALARFMHTAPTDTTTTRRRSRLMEEEEADDVDGYRRHYPTTTNNTTTNNTTTNNNNNDRKRRESSEVDGLLRLVERLKCPIGCSSSSLPSSGSSSSLHVALQLLQLWRPPAEVNTVADNGRPPDGLPTLWRRFVFSEDDHGNTHDHYHDDDDDDHVDAAISPSSSSSLSSSSSSAGEAEEEAALEAWREKGSPRQRWSVLVRCAARLVWQQEQQQDKKTSSGSSPLCLSSPSSATERPWKRMKREDGDGARHGETIGMISEANQAPLKDFEEEEDEEKETRGGLPTHAMRRTTTTAAALERLFVLLLSSLSAVVSSSSSLCGTTMSSQASSYSAANPHESSPYASATMMARCGLHVVLREVWVPVMEWAVADCSSCGWRSPQRAEGAGAAGRPARGDPPDVTRTHVSRESTSSLGLLRTRRRPVGWYFIRSLVETGGALLQVISPPAGRTHNHGRRRRRHCHGRTDGDEETPVAMRGEVVNAHRTALASLLAALWSGAVLARGSRGYVTHSSLSRPPPALSSCLQDSTRTAKRRRRERSDATEKGDDHLESHTLVVNVDETDDNDDTPQPEELEDHHPNNDAEEMKIGEKGVSGFGVCGDGGGGVNGPAAGCSLPSFSYYDDDWNTLAATERSTTAHDDDHHHHGSSNTFMTATEHAFLATVDLMFVQQWAELQEQPPHHPPPEPMAPRPACGEHHSLDQEEGLSNHPVRTATAPSPSLSAGPLLPVTRRTSIPPPAEEAYTLGDLLQEWVEQVGRASRVTGGGATRLMKKKEEGEEEESKEEEATRRRGCAGPLRRLLLGLRLPLVVFSLLCAEGNGAGVRGEGSSSYSGSSSFALLCQLLSHHHLISSALLNEKPEKKDDDDDDGVESEQGLTALLAMCCVRAMALAIPPRHRSDTLQREGSRWVNQQKENDDKPLISALLQRATTTVFISRSSSASSSSSSASMYWREFLVLSVLWSLAEQRVDVPLAELSLSPVVLQRFMALLQEEDLDDSEEDTMKKEHVKNHRLDHPTHSTSSSSSGSRAPLAVLQMEYHTACRERRRSCRQDGHPSHRHRRHDALVVVRRRKRTSPQAAASAATTQEEEQEEDSPASTTPHPQPVLASLRHAITAVRRRLSELELNQDMDDERAVVSAACPDVEGLRAVWDELMAAGARLLEKESGRVIPRSAREERKDVET